MLPEALQHQMLAKLVEIIALLDTNTPEIQAISEEHRQRLISDWRWEANKVVNTCTSLLPDARAKAA